MINLLGLFITIKNGIFQQLKIQISKPLIFAPEQFEECFKEMVGKSFEKESCLEKVANFTKNLHI